MSDLLIRLKEQMVLNPNNAYIPEIEYLKESTLCETLNKAFTELYRVKPENPIIFLSKWLTRESKSMELLRKYNEDALKREKLKMKYHLKDKKEEAKNQLNEEAKKVYSDHQESLIKEIQTCPDFWLGFNHICEELKILTNATGVYIALYDLKRKEVSEDDDETGHIFQPNTQVIRYIAWNNDHDFLHGKCIEPNQGITYDLFNVKSGSPPPQQGEQTQPENPPPENPEGGNVEGGSNNVVNVNNNIEKEEENERVVNSLLVDDVVVEPKMKFFREPRLGCYYCLDITYETSMSYNSLLSAIQCLKEYTENKNKQDEEYREWFDKQEEIKAKIEDLKEAQGIDTEVKEEEKKE
jgi:hypothetical protein